MKLNKQTNISKEAAFFLINDFYVDDGITSIDDVKSADFPVVAARLLCNKSNMRLCKLGRDQSSALISINSSEKQLESSPFNELLRNKCPLGVHWNFKTTN